MATAMGQADTAAISTGHSFPNVARKLLSFGLGREEYGLDILSVREIIGLIDITPLPRTPDYVKGVINLRGKIIPVIELRNRFDLPPVDYTEETCIIVVDLPGTSERESTLTGVIVDTVREVLDIPAGAIEPPPTFGCSIPLDFITGIGKVKEKVVVMLDAAKVMNPAAVDALSAAPSTLASGDIPGDQLTA